MYRPRAAALLSISFFLCLIGTSCTNPRRTIYFQNNVKADSVVQTETIANDVQTIIQPDDILAINVSSISSITPEADPVRVFREGGTQFSVAAAAGTQVNNPGYLVDAEGFIDYPVVGKVKLGGLTIRQAKEELATRVKKIVKDPVVEVRIINYKVVVLGEVGRPGTLIAPNHKLTILEALAAAGDIPVTGRKDNVSVIRTIGGKREYAQLNLNSRNIFQSPYYYLRQNDIVVVEASSVRRQSTNSFTQIYLPVITALVTIGLSVFAITRARQ